MTPLSRLRYVGALLLLIASPVFPDSWLSPAYEWHRIELEHFTIYFTPKSDTMAKRIATYAPKARETVRNFLEISPPKCPIVIYPNQDAFNGYVAPLPYRIVLYDTTLADPIQFSPSTQDMVYTLLLHEYTHFAHATYLPPPLKTLAPIIGYQYYMYFGLSPAWFIEGLATYVESRNSTSGRGNSHHFSHQFFRDMGHNNRQMSAKNTRLRISGMMPLNRVYSFGYFFVSFLADTYGETLLVRLVKEFNLFNSPNFQQLLYRITSKSESELDAEFHQWLAKNIPENGRHYTPILAGHRDAIQDIEWGPDTLWAYMGGLDSPRTIQAIDPDTLIKRDEIPVQNAHGFSSLIEANQRLYATNLITGTHLKSQTYNVIEINPQSHAILQKTFQAQYAEIAHIQDQQFAVIKSDGVDHTILLTSLDTSATVPLYSSTSRLVGLYYDAHRHRLIVSEKRDQRLQPIVIDLSSNVRGPLENFPVISGLNFQRIDAQSLAFTTDYFGTWNIYRFHESTGEIRAISDSQFGLSNYTMSPTGRRLAAIQNGLTGDEVVVLPVTMKHPPLTVASSTPTPDVDLSDSPQFKTKSGIPLAHYRPLIYGGFVGFEREWSLATYLQGADPTHTNRYRVQTELAESGSSAFGDWINTTYTPTIRTQFELNSPSHELFLIRRNSLKSVATLPILHAQFPRRHQTNLSAGLSVRHLYYPDSFGLDSFNESFLTGILTVSHHMSTTNYFSHAAPRESISGAFSLNFGQMFQKFSYLGVASTTLNTNSPIRHQQLQQTLMVAQKNTPYLDFPIAIIPRQATFRLPTARRLIGYKGQYLFPIAQINDGITWPFTLIFTTLKGAVFFDALITPDSPDVRSYTTGGQLFTNMVSLGSLSLQLKLTSGYDIRNRSAFYYFGLYQDLF